MTDSTPFQIGDIVQLKSGGPLMTVACLHRDAPTVECKWFSGENLQENWFATDALTSELKELPPPQPGISGAQYRAAAKASESSWHLWSEKKPQPSPHQVDKVQFVMWTDAASPARPMGMTPSQTPKGTHWCYIPELPEDAT